MNFSEKRVLGLAVILCLGLLLPACSSDDDPTNPGGGTDTTAPRVTDVSPPDGMLEVATAGQVVFTFSEAMDPASATGQVTVSQGTVDGLSWTDDMTLAVTYSGWPEGTEVTVTAGVGLKDTAGNPLAGPFSVSMWTMSTTLAVMNFTPADGAVNIDRTASINLLFSDLMDPSSLETGVTISDNTKAVHPFTVENINGYLFYLVPDEPLPATTEITVTLGTGVRTSQGENLAEAVMFSFTTNNVIDTTPPTIVSIDPASGSIMPANQAAITIVFSEPMEVQNFSPTMMSGQFGWLISQTLGSIQWSAGNTVLTVPLPADLPAGLPLQVKFAGYADANGVVQPAETDWTCTVAGTADPYPVSDGYRWTSMGTWSTGPAGSDIPTDGGDYAVYYQFQERAAANQWDLQKFSDPSYTTLDNYMIQTVTGQGVFLTGIAEEAKAVLMEYFLTNPLTQTEFPLVAGNTWTSSASVTLPDGTVSATMSGEAIGKEDLEIGPAGSGFGVVWTDVWRVEVTLDVFMGGEMTSNQMTTYWIAPGIGVVREFNREDQLLPLDQAGWHETDLWLNINLD